MHNPAEVLMVPNRLTSSTYCRMKTLGKRFQAKKFSKGCMNGRERMLTALELGEPDQVPIWELIINDPVIHALTGPISREDFAERQGLDGLTIFEDTR